MSSRIANSRRTLVLASREVKYGGVAVEARSGEIWTLRDGKVVRFPGYDTRAEALKAAGLSE